MCDWKNAETGRPKEKTTKSLKIGILQSCCLQRPSTIAFDERALLAKGAIKFSKSSNCKGKQFKHNSNNSNTSRRKSLRTLLKHPCEGFYCSFWSFSIRNKNQRSGKECSNLQSRYGGKMGEELKVTLRYIEIRWAQQQESATFWGSCHRDNRMALGHCIVPALAVEDQ